LRQDDECIRRLAEVLSHPQGPENAKELLRERLPAALGVEMSFPPTDAQVRAVLQELARCHQRLDDFAEQQAMLLVGELIRLFGGDGHTYDDLRQAVNLWCNNLPESQRAHRFSDEARHLQNVVEAEGEVKERMLVRLPKNLGLGPYTDWAEDTSSDLFLTKVRLAKTTIENYQPTSPPGVSSIQTGEETSQAEGGAVSGYGNQGPAIAEAEGTELAEKVKAEIKNLLSRRQLSNQLLVKVLKDLLAELEP